jgi:hypothetical protein
LGPLRSDYAEHKERQKGRKEEKEDINKVKGRKNITRNRE